MNSLPRAGEAFKGFILFLFNNEEVAIDIKIATAILKAKNYTYLTAPLRQNDPNSIENLANRTNYANRTTLIPEKNKLMEMNYYLCCKKIKNRRANEI